MPSPAARIRTLGLIFLAALVIIVGRLWWLQLTRWSDYYAARALANRMVTVYKPAPRGLIFDREGRVLAENREVWRLNVAPSQLPDDEVLLEREIAFLASALSTEDLPVSTVDVREAIEKADAAAAEATPLGNVGQDLSFDQVARIEEHQMELPGFSVATATRRHYPYGTVAAQAIGYARPISRQQLDDLQDCEYPPDAQDPTATEQTETLPDRVYGPSSVIGAVGAEALCELDRSEGDPVPLLQGRRGRAQYEVDAGLTPQRCVAERPAIPGANVFLTLDAEIQRVAERALREAISHRSDGMGAVVVMDVNNGDVLVLASEPCLDPNDWVSGFTPELWAEVMAAPGLPQFDKATQGCYPPGSVFKVVSTCAAIETTGVTPQTTTYCKGRITVGRHHQLFKCWAAERGHGLVDLYEAISLSCNIFFYDCVLRFHLKADDIARYAHRFGLGETTGLGLPGEVSGEVPSAEFSISDTGRPWRQGNSLNFVIGQDRLTVTPLQMCRVCAAIANPRRRLYTPHIIEKTKWPAYLRRQGIEYTTPTYRRLKVKSETLAVVRRGMRMAVSGEHGTAAGLRDLGVAVTGKTGSAQHRTDEPTHAWFIGFGPYDAPRYAVCVFIARGGAGGKMAVPVAKQVFRALFDLHDPDDPRFKLPEPMSPETVAALRRQRVAAAKARAERQAAEAEGDE